MFAAFYRHGKTFIDTFLPVKNGIYTGRTTSRPQLQAGVSAQGEICFLIATADLRNK